MFDGSADDLKLVFGLLGRSGPVATPWSASPLARGPDVTAQFGSARPNGGSAKAIADILYELATGKPTRPKKGQR